MPSAMQLCSFNYSFLSNVSIKYTHKRTASTYSIFVMGIAAGCRPPDVSTCGHRNAALELAFKLSANIICQFLERDGGSG